MSLFDMLQGYFSPQGVPNYNGNIDLGNRPIVRNSDGSINTTLSMSFGNDEGEVLVPRVSQEGRIMSPDEAIAYYYKTGQHLGKYDNPEMATAMGQLIHGDQQRRYVK